MLLIRAFAVWSFRPCPSCLRAGFIVPAGAGWEHASQARIDCVAVREGALAAGASGRFSGSPFSLSLLSTSVLSRFSVRYNTCSKQVQDPPLGSPPPGVSPQQTGRGVSGRPAGRRPLVYPAGHVGAAAPGASLRRGLVYRETHTRRAHD